MKRWCQIVAICLIGLLSKKAASQTFSIPFAIDSMPTIGNSVELRDSFIWVSGYMTDTAVFNGIRSYLAKFDYSGNLISKFTIRPPQYMHYLSPRENSTITTKDGGLATVGYVQDTSWASIPILCFTKYNPIGNFQFDKIIPMNLIGYKTTFGYRVLEYDNGDYFIAGELQLANNAIKTFLTKIDSTGNVSFTKTYNNIPLENGARGLCKLSNGNLLISSYVQSNSLVHYWQYVERTCFLEVDTAGNLIDYHCTIDTNTRAAYNVRMTADGNYLSSGSFYPGPRVQGLAGPFTQYIAKWDTSFNRIWELNSGDATYQDNAYTDFEQTSQNDIIACGQSVGNSGVFAGFNGILAKISDAGQLDWYHGYRLTPVNNLHVEHHLFDVDLMDNGDIVAVGYWQSYSIPYHPFGPVQVGWLIRVHSDGCMDDGSCGLTGIDNRQQTIDNRQIQIRPNPANGSVRVEVENEMIGGELKVYDVTGKMLLQRRIETEQMQVDVSNMSKGLYVVLAEKQLRQARGKLVVE